MNSESIPVPQMNADRMKPSKHLSAIKSTVLFFLILFPLFLLHKVVHEGGHAFVNLIHRISDTNIYVHPFSFSGYSRPFVDLGVTGNAWYVAAGPIAGVLVPLIIFIPLWKHRSINTLPLVLLFPWAVLSPKAKGVLSGQERSPPASWRCSQRVYIAPGAGPRGKNTHAYRVH